MTNKENKENKISVNKVELVAIAKAGANVTLKELLTEDPSNIEVLLQENEIEDTAKHDRKRSS